MTLSLKVEGRVAWLIFDHGKANEMGSQELEDFETLCARLETGECSTLISSSTRRSKRGTAIFISGANVTERVGWSRDQVASHVRRQRRVLRRVRELPVFHIAVINGVALGWGTEYCLTADYRIACPESVFGLPETGLGILPGAGGSSELWSQIGVAQALRLGMTGERIDAQEACRIGLVQEVQADIDSGWERAKSLALQVAKNSPTAVASFKRACLGAVGLPVDQRMELEAQAYEHCLDSGEAAIGREHFGEIRAGQVPPWGDLERFVS